MDDASLTLSELVTNAVLHGRPPVRVDLSCTGGTLEIAVVDAAPAPPVLRPERADLDRDLALVLDVEAGLDGAVAERDPRLDIGDAGLGGRRARPAAGRGAGDAVGHRAAADRRQGGLAAAPVSDTWGPGAACSCDHDPAAHPLPSGLRVLHRED